jgi:hypothetical protein
MVEYGPWASEPGFSDGTLAEAETGGQATAATNGITTAPSHPARVPGLMSDRLELNETSCFNQLLWHQQVPVPAK